MVKLKKLTKEELIDEIDRLRQKVIELQSEIIRLKQPYNWPGALEDKIPDVWPIISIDKTEDSLPKMLYEWRSWEYSNLPISASGTRVLPGD